MTERDRTPAEQDGPLPQAIWEGVVRVGPHSIKIAVLDDGRRIIEAESMNLIMDWLLDGATASEAKAVMTLTQERGIPDEADFESPASRSDVPPGDTGK